MYQAYEYRVFEHSRDITQSEKASQWSLEDPVISQLQKRHVIIDLVLQGECSIEATSHYQASKAETSQLSLNCLDNNDQAP